MGKHPVLRPREVSAILEKLGFVEARQRGSHKQYRHRTDEARQFLFTALATSRRSYCDKSQKTLDSLLTRCSRTGEHYLFTPNMRKIRWITDFDSVTFSAYVIPK
jgi:hypothetical protein